MTNKTLMTCKFQRVRGGGGGARPYPTLAFVKVPFERMHGSEFKIKVVFELTTIYLIEQIS